MLLTWGFSFAGMAEEHKKSGDKEKSPKIGALPKDESSPTGYYIPKDLEDAFLTLDRILSAEAIEEIKNKPERKLNDFHFGFGSWIRSNWINAHYTKDSPGSPLTEYFLSFGKEVVPDDMSSIVIKTYWRRLHDKPLRLNEELERYDLYWKKNKKPVGLVSPIDGAEIKFYMKRNAQCEGEQQYAEVEGVGKVPVSCGPSVHLGRSKSDGTIWAYQYKKGLFEPGPEYKNIFKEYWSKYGERLK